MRYWWVNQNQTYKSELQGGYVWSPKRNKNGARNQFYENMREISPGDIIFSFRNRKVGAIGRATTNCYEAPKPVEFGSVGLNWEQIGWRADVVYKEIEFPIKPRDHIDDIKLLLPEKYSPLQQNGDGLQSVYLAAISKDLAELLWRLLEHAGNDLSSASVPSIDNTDAVRSELESRLEESIHQTEDLIATEKEQLVKSRRGQGRFRENVLAIEKRCRLSGVSDSRFLIASHIKPWRSSSNTERLDGENGLMLTPNVDSLFDRGFISFDDDGLLLISPVVQSELLHQLGVPTDTIVYAGEFTQGQRNYLSYHRREVFLQAGAF